MKKGDSRAFLMYFMFLAIFILVAGLVSALDSIEVNNALLKFSVKAGNYAVKPIAIIAGEDATVNVASINLRGASLSEDVLLMKSGETRSISVAFNSSDIEPGVSVGYISISTKDKDLRVPVVLEVESRDVLFDSTIEIPSAYTEIAPGSKVIAQIKMFDLTTEGTGPGLSPASAIVEYYIYREDGTQIVSETESIVVNKDSGMTKSLKLPEDAKDGIYFVAVVLKYGSSVGISSAMFSVSSGAPFSGFKIGNLTSAWIMTLVTIIILALIFVSFFFFLVKDRDKFMVHLKKYHDVELKKQEEYLKEQKCALQKKKCFTSAQINKEVTSKVHALKQTQRRRVEELKELREKGDEEVMNKKIKEWTTQGYNTMLLQSKLSETSSSDMRKIMAKWKKKGYVFK